MRSLSLMVAMAGLALLTACGVDGPPITPEPKTPRPDENTIPEPGITISGNVGVGVAGGSVSADVERY